MVWIMDRRGCGATDIVMPVTFFFAWVAVAVCTLLNELLINHRKRWLDKGPVPRRLRGYIAVLEGTRLDSDYGPGHKKRLIEVIPHLPAVQGYAALL